MTKVTFPPNLKIVIEKVITDELINHIPTTAWANHVASKLEGGIFKEETKNFHRKVILGQGQSDFRNEFEGLTTDDKALLYLFYYFQMHFTSSVALFYQNQPFFNNVFLTSKRILFIDIGCGPYTSGFAFLYYTRLLGVSEILTPLVGGTQLEYYAFDNADSIQNLGARLLTAYETAENDGLFHFQTKTQYSDFKDIPSLITDADSETSIILNCCYFFASKTIDITTFVTSIQSLLDNNPKAKILLLYQNPADYTGEISQNFINFKQAIKGLKSESGKIAGLRYSYDDEFKSTNWATLKLTLNFEILKNY